MLWANLGNGNLLLAKYHDFGIINSCIKILNDHAYKDLAKAVIIAIKIEELVLFYLKKQKQKQKNTNKKHNNKMLSHDTILKTKLWIGK